VLTVRYKLRLRTDLSIKHTMYDTAQTGGSTWIDKINTRIDVRIKNGVT
jgi:hypothetical protein